MAKVVTPCDALTYKIIGLAMAVHNELGPLVHEQQVISYLAASGLEVGLLINFGAVSLQHKRIFPPKAVQNSPAFQARKQQTQIR